MYVHSFGEASPWNPPCAQT